MRLDRTEKLIFGGMLGLFILYAFLVILGAIYEEPCWTVKQCSSFTTIVPIYNGTSFTYIPMIQTSCTCPPKPTF